MINLKIAKLKNKIEKLKIKIKIEELKDKIWHEELNLHLWQSDEFQKPYLLRINNYKREIYLLK